MQVIKFGLKHKYHCGAESNDCQRCALDCMTPILIEYAIQCIAECSACVAGISRDGKSPCEKCGKVRSLIERILGGEFDFASFEEAADTAGALILKIPLSSSVSGFIRHMMNYWGSGEQVVQKMFESTDYSSEWSAVTATCIRCGDRVPISDKNKIGHHAIKNPDSDMPYYITCPGVGYPAVIRPKRQNFMLRSTILHAMNVARIELI